MELAQYLSNGVVNRRHNRSSLRKCEGNYLGYTYIENSKTSLSKQPVVVDFMSRKFSGLCHITLQILAFVA